MHDAEHLFECEINCLALDLEQKETTQLNIFKSHIMGGGLGPTKVLARSNFLSTAERVGRVKQGNKGFSSLRR